MKNRKSVNNELDFDCLNIDVPAFKPPERKLLTLSEFFKAILESNQGLPEATSRHIITFA
jgi:hypothetical protein